MICIGNRKDLGLDLKAGGHDSVSSLAASELKRCRVVIYYSLMCKVHMELTNLALIIRILV